MDKRPKAPPPPEDIAIFEILHKCDASYRHTKMQGAHPSVQCLCRIFDKHTGKVELARDLGYNKESTLKAAVNKLRLEKGLAIREYTRDEQVDQRLDAMEKENKKLREQLASGNTDEQPRNESPTIDESPPPTARKKRRGRPPKIKIPGDEVLSST